MIRYFVAGTSFPEMERVGGELAPVAPPLMVQQDAGELRLSADKENIVPKPHNAKITKYTLLQKQQICQLVESKTLKKVFVDRSYYYVEPVATSTAFDLMCQTSFMHVQSAASRVYQVNRRTITAWMKNKPWARENINIHNLTMHPGRPVIYDAMEEILYQRILDLRQQGIGMYLYIVTVTWSALFPLIIPSICAVIIWFSFSVNVNAAVATREVITMALEIEPNLFGASLDDDHAGMGPRQWKYVGRSAPLRKHTH
jgi:hypothetical protein